MTAFVLGRKQIYLPLYWCVLRAVCCVCRVVCAVCVVWCVLCVLCYVLCSVCGVCLSAQACFSKWTDSRLLIVVRIDASCFEMDVLRSAPCDRYYICIE